jgi:hypothetical protein
VWNARFCFQLIPKLIKSRVICGLNWLCNSGMILMCATVCRGARTPHKLTVGPRSGGFSDSSPPPLALRCTGQHAHCLGGVAGGECCLHRIAFLLTGQHSKNDIGFLGHNFYSTILLLVKYQRNHLLQSSTNGTCSISPSAHEMLCTPPPTHTPRPPQ